MKNKQVWIFGAISILSFLFILAPRTNMGHKSGDAELTEFLAEYGSGMGSNTLNSENATSLLLQSCNYLTPAIYKKLTAFNIDYTYKDANWNSFLHSCQKGKYMNDILNKTLAAGVTVDISNNKGRSPWAQAVEQGNKEGAQWFKEHGANMKIVDIKGNPAWFWANVNMHDTLRLWGADYANISNKIGQTALLYNLQQGNEERSKMLLAEESNLEYQDKLGNTALYYASRSGMLEVATIILKRNRELMFIENRQHETPSDVAHGYVSNLFRQYGYEKSNY